MIYDYPDPKFALTQGDIIDQCPLVYWEFAKAESGVIERRSGTTCERVLVLTQACDLSNTKTAKVQVAVVHAAQTLVDEGFLKPQTIQDQVRRHRVYGWYFLPASEAIPESIVDLRDIHTVPRELLEEQIQKGLRLATVVSPFREHLAQHFAITYSRVALPGPYPTDD